MPSPPPLGYLASCQPAGAAICAWRAGEGRDGLVSTPAPRPTPTVSIALLLVLLQLLFRLLLLKELLLLLLC